VDSSDFATGALLSWQSPEDNKWHPVAFLSKSLSPVEWNYEIHDKEMLAIVRVLEEWRHFVEGAEHRCEIWMDHKNLQYFMTVKKLNQRQARWSLLLVQFDFIMHHCPGKSMGKTDTLSHQSDHRTGLEDNQHGPPYSEFLHGPSIGRFRGSRRGTSNPEGYPEGDA